jgi:hypothetical protein
MSNSNQQSALSQQPLRRYPGVKPFETSERALFFGRDKDIEDLLDLVWLEKLVVLFGKSGYGKSSLINAGILPEIEQEAVPIVVRLGSYVAWQMPTPLDNLQRKIDDALSNNPEADFIDAMNVPKTLWHQMKRKQSGKQRRFVLVFDQFEEFFTYPIAEQNAFKEQLADLLYTEVPQAIRNLNDTFTESQQTFIATPFDAKVLFAIRADRMSLLDSMKDKLPAILQKRYELKGLSEEQAKKAIDEPAKHEGNYESPNFSYSTKALDIMTDRLAETKGVLSSGIEAFQLQILCGYLEDKIIKGEIVNNHIEPQYFENKISEIYEGYYQRLLDKLEPIVKHSAEILIEEALIFEDERTGEIRRLSVDSDVLIKRFENEGLTYQVLQILEDNFLIRRESTSMGGFNYEICHDSLLAPISKIKAIRKEKELQKLEFEQKRKKRNKFLYTIGLLGLIAFSIVAIGVTIYVLKLKNEAVAALKIAEIESIKAQKALDSFLEEKKGKRILEFKSDLQNVNVILKGGNCPPDELLKRIRDMQVSYPNDLDIQGQINIMLNQLASNNCK